MERGGGRTISTRLNNKLRNHRVRNDEFPEDATCGLLYREKFQWDDRLLETTGPSVRRPALSLTE
eukprot:2848083-Amphidinium_carterae.1